MRDSQTQGLGKTLKKVFIKWGNLVYNKRTSGQRGITLITIQMLLKG
jgi:hypothetical protein